MSPIQSLADRAQELSRSIDGWNNAYMVFVALTVVLAALVFISQFVVIRKSKSLNSVQEQIAQDKDLQVAKAQAETAKAQLELRQTVVRFARRAGDRIADFNKLVEAFKDKPKGTLEVRYKGGDSEAKKFSEDIQRAFQSMGWTVLVRAIEAEERLGGIPLDQLTGTYIFCRNDEELKAFLMPFLSAFPFGAQAIGTSARELPDDRLVIVAGVRDKL